MLLTIRILEDCDRDDDHGGGDLQQQQQQQLPKMLSLLSYSYYPSCHAFLSTIVKMVQEICKPDSLYNISCR